MILTDKYAKINVKVYLFHCKIVSGGKMDVNKMTEKDIDITKIPDAPRPYFPVGYIFTTKYSTCAAFEKPDFETGYHVQEFFEICLISKGCGFHIIEDSVVKATRGDVFIVPPGRKHAFIGGKGFNVYYIHLSPSFLEKNAPRLKTLPAFLSLFEVEPLMRINGAKYRHLYLEEKVLGETLSILDGVSDMWQYDEATCLIKESYIIIALTILCREYAKLQTIVGKNAHNDRLFMETISTILDNYKQKLTIEELAETAGLSRSAYIRRFSETMGMPPRRFILRHRIKMAIKLLEDTTSPIVSIAEQTGFYDTAHFTKCFTAAVGISPTEFRRRKLKMEN